MIIEIDFLVIELEPRTFHPLVKAEFSGLKDYWWIIDSGASKSIMDIQYSSLYVPEEIEPVMATGLGKEVVSTSSGIIASFTLGNYNFGPLTVALVDFEHINEEYKKFSEKKIIGLIGCDFLYTHKAVIDFRMQKLSLSF